ncbi:MAG: hypothetical protein J1E80_06285 [Desulfovibrionaceae bacterium]|nr:hypothetical protein [Desulfovibrionaceae bacterium]
MDTTRHGGPEQPGGSLLPVGGTVPPLNGTALEPRPLPSDDMSLALRARDRALLYTRGMGLEPLSGVELALESLRRAAGGTKGDSPCPWDAARVMRALWAVLEDHGLRPGVDAPDGGPLVSSPPLQRSPMVPSPDTWFPRGRIRRSS